ncbi:MAG: extracellular solute-binding protein [Saccharofermentanales bacterium]
MKKRLQIIALLSVFIITATTGAGCAKKPTVLEVVSKIPKQTLSISVTFSGVELVTFQKTLEAINVDASEYKLELKEVSNQRYMQELESLINTNLAPDLMMISNYATDLIQREVFLDITGYLAKDRNIKTDNYYKPAIDAISDKNKIYGLPFTCSPLVLLYNQNLFEDSGVALPTSGWKWDDFRNAAKKLTKDTDGDGKIDQWGFNYPYIVNFLQLMHSYDVDFNNINTPKTVAALTMYKNIFNDKTSPSDEERNSLVQDMPFNVGKAAMDIRTFDPSYNKSIEGNIDRIRIAEMPYGTVKNTLFSQKTLSINSKTKNKDVAYKAFSDVILTLQKGDFISPLKSGLDNSTYNKMNKKYDMTVIRNSLSYSENYFATTNMTVVYNVIQNVLISSVYSNNKTIEAALIEAADQIKNRQMNKR